MTPPEERTDGRILGARALESGRVGTVTEVERGDLLRLETWEEAFPGLACGITRARAGTFGVSSSTAAELLARFGALADSLRFGRVAVPLQVHGSSIRILGGGAREHREDGCGAIVTLAGRVDGLVTASAGLLLASTAADCVPVFAVGAEKGVIGLAHAGWRGVAAGTLERCLERMSELGADSAAVRVHLGPAICGACYEVDEPVLRALGLPGERALVDLRGLLAERASAAGVAGVSVSSHCTRCASPDLHSHRARGPKAGRMAAFIGIRDR